MSLGMLGTKVGMTQIFNKQGNAIPVTVLKVGPCTITQIKKNKNYANIQIAYKYINPNQLNKANIGHFKKITVPCFKYLKEYKSMYSSNLTVNVGQVLSVQKFQVGNYINVSGISIGKGFSGYQKKHNFSRGPMSHGSKNHRKPGSIGAGTTPGRVFPGKKMAGRMGNKKVTIKNLQIISINPEKNIIIIKGSVPGKSGNIIYINKIIK